jgi:hypothetical protein
LPHKQHIMETKTTTFTSKAQDGNQQNDANNNDYLFFPDALL